jgi:hypothetical protein
MSSLPRRERLLPRPVDSNQDHLGAAGRLSAFGRTRTGSAKRAGYLFVNKSQDSECLSNCKIDRAQTKINAHVQRFRLSTESHVRSSGEFTNRSTGETRNLYRPFRRRDAGAVAGDGEGANNETEALDLLSQRREYYNGGRDIVPILHSNNFLEGDAFDPFSATAVRVDKSAHNVLQYFLHVGWKAHLRNIGRADQVRWSTSFGEVSSIVRGCLSNEMHMYAFLACIPMRMKVYGIPLTFQTESQEVTMSKALRAMRAYFAQLSAAPIDHHAILDIFFVSLSAFFRRDFAEMRTHLHMIRYIVDSLGGFANVSLYIREVCCYTELCFALRTGERPLFELTWDPGPVECNGALQVKSACWPPEIKTCGSGFEIPLREGFFDGPARTIIAELVIDIPALEYVRNDAEAPPADSQWACIRSRAMLHRLLSLEKYSGQASFQERKVQCVITALAMLMGYENLCVSPIRYTESQQQRFQPTWELGKTQ